MKLYTEEQLKEVYLEGWDDGQHDNIGYIDRVFNSLTPIELPSDEEIENEYKPKTMYDIGWLDGAKWLKEQIINQNK